MTTKNRHHPVFVYGTLRPGCGNYQHRLSGLTVQERPATARGLALYRSGIPYAIRQVGSTVTGTLITIKLDCYEQVLRSLDQLEGFRPEEPELSHYLRETTSITATTPISGGGTFQTFHIAWVYLASPTVDLTRMRPVPNGDWLADARSA